MRGSTCRPACRSACRRTCPTASSRWSGARRSAASSATRCTSSSTAASAGWPSRSASAIARRWSTGRRRWRPAGARAGPPRPRRAARLRPGRPAGRGRRRPPSACPSVEALERWQATTAQFQLDRQARAANVAGAFRPRSPGAIEAVRGPLGRPRRRRHDHRRHAVRVRDGAPRWRARRRSRRSPSPGSGDRPTVPRAGSDVRPDYTRARALGPREVTRADHRQGQERRGPGPRPRVCGAEARAHRAARRRPDGRHRRALERASPQRRRTPTSSRSRWS